MNARDILNAHGPFLADQNEVEIDARLAAGADVADLALRTCLCGARLDGFDAYHAHLVQVLTTTAELDQGEASHDNHVVQPRAARRG